MSDETRNTDKFLRLFSSHLASRPECKGVEYIVMIHSNGQIESNSAVMVFPSMHDRKHEHKESVIRHILARHLTWLNAGIDTDGAVLYKKGTLVTGIYQYKLAFNGRRRKWVRIK